MKAIKWGVFAGVVLVWLAMPDALAFSIPQQKEDVAASKLAHIQLNAAVGEPRAQYLLGLMQLSGRYTAKNMLQGAHWLGKAAEQGHIKAQQTLADLSFEGKLIPRDLEVAEKWYLALANTEQKWAQFRLGFIYAAGGSGVSRHCGKALDYFSRVGDNVALGNVAWILSTCPEKQYRDGGRALDLSLKLLAHNNEDPSCLDNLAAAYAELGKFSQAVETQEKAIFALARTNNESKIADFRLRLQQYKQNQAYREILPLSIEQ